jgi:hypothetical protein
MGILSDAPLSSSALRLFQFRLKLYTFFSLKFRKREESPKVRVDE